jgi:IQ calmodulin-binding motif
MADEQAAALKIQTTYRRYRARSYADALRKNRAATKIQAGFHGFLTRKKAKQMRLV